MTYHPETYSHIRDKVKVVLALSNMILKLEHATGIDTSYLFSLIHLI